MTPRREGSGAAATLFLGPFIVAAAGMGINVVRLSEGNIDMAVISLPSGRPQSDDLDRRCAGDARRGLVSGESGFGSRSQSSL